MTRAAIEALGTPEALMAFHARHKMELLAHDPGLARTLGRLAGSAAAERFAATRDAYARTFAVALARAPSIAGHANALQHLGGHVKDRGAAGAIAARIEAYRRGEAPLDEVKRLLREQLAREGDAWASTQTYLADATHT